MNCRQGNLLKRHAQINWWFVLLLCGLAPVYGSAYGQTYQNGWTPNTEAVRQFKRNNPRPYFEQWGDVSGSGEGRVVLLTPFLEIATGKDYEPKQQQTTDCVGFAYASGVDHLTATQIYLHGTDERWVAEACAEAIYGGARINVAHRRAGKGAVGAWAAEWVRDYGVVLRLKYGRWDLREYDWQLSRRWGRSGVPNQLCRYAAEHRVKTVSLVRTWRGVRDAVANGHPVVICAREGFHPERDQDGFLTPYGVWQHATCVVGITDRERPGALIANSWGANWVRGPPGFYCPPGCFWVDADVIQQMVSQEDSFALSGYDGYPKQDGLDYRLR